MTILSLSGQSGVLGVYINSFLKINNNWLKPSFTKPSPPPAISSHPFPRRPIGSIHKSGMIQVWVLNIIVQNDFFTCLNGGRFGSIPNMYMASVCFVDVSENM